MHVASSGSHLAGAGLRSLLAGCRPAQPGQPRQAIRSSAPERGLGFRHSVRGKLRRVPRRGRTRRRGDRACRSGLSGHRRRCRDSQASSPTACADRHAGLRPERRRTAHRQTDRCDHQRHPVALEQARNSRWRPTRRPTPRNPPAIRSAAQMCLQDLLRILPRPDGRGGQRAAPSRTILFWRWSAIRDCGRSSSPAVRNWAPPTGAETFRGKPMSEQEVTDVVAWLASHRAEFPGQPYSASRIRSTRSLTDVESKQYSPGAGCS